jgi:hypothetical protein
MATFVLLLVSARVFYSSPSLSLEAKVQEYQPEHPYIFMAWDLIAAQGQIYRLLLCAAVSTRVLFKIHAECGLEVSREEADESHGNTAEVLRYEIIPFVVVVSRIEE